MHPMTEHQQLKPRKPTLYEQSLAFKDSGHYQQDWADVLVSIRSCAPQHTEHSKTAVYPSYFLCLRNDIKGGEGTGQKPALPPCPSQMLITRSPSGEEPSRDEDIEFARKLKRGARHRQQQAVIYGADVPSQVTHQ